MVATSIRAKKLLHSAAAAQEARIKTINKDEISKKIGEIKYLSTQKNVPRLSLRKEIVHLEQKLQHVFELEQKLLKNENTESKKVASLKKQIDSLKKRLNTAEDKELRDKVTKLYHILTELLAKSELKKDVQLSQALLKELHNVDPKQAAAESKEQNSEANLKVRRVAMILHRIKSVKHELELKAELMSSDSGGLEKIKAQIKELEIKIADLSVKYPDAVEELKVQENPVDTTNVGGAVSSDVNHTMMMGSPIETTAESGQQMSALEQNLQGAISQPEEIQIEDQIISELPLPPPPRIRKK